MTRHTLALSALFTAALLVSVSVIPAKTAPEKQFAWTDTQPQTMQSADVRALVGASFHAIHAGF